MDESDAGSVERLDQSEHGKTVLMLQGHHAEKNLSLRYSDVTEAKREIFQIAVVLELQPINKHRAVGGACLPKPYCI